MAKRIFISHRNVGDDLTLARALRRRLKETGHQVFLDAVDILPGDEWPARIHQELEKADLLVVLLSEHIAERPDMVTAEVSIAKDLQRQSESGRPRIVPVRLGGGAVASLRFDLRAMVESLQWERWSDAGDTERLVKALNRVLSGPAESDVAREVTARIFQELIELRQKLVKQRRKTRKAREEAGDFRSLLDQERTQARRQRGPVAVGLWAIALAAIVFALSWYEAQRRQRIAAIQNAAAEARDPAVGALLLAELADSEHQPGSLQDLRVAHQLATAMPALLRFRGHRSRVRSAARPAAGRRCRGW